MSKSIFRYFCTIIISGLLVFTTIFMVIMSSEIQNNATDDMKFAAQIIESQIDYNDDIQKQVNEYVHVTDGENTRITIIGADGTVYGDSEATDLENHLDRPEVIEAIENVYGISNRYSDTTNMKMLYVAYYNGEFVTRISIPYDGIVDNMETMIVPFMIGAAISFMLAIVMSKSLTNRFTDPIMEISNEVENMSTKKELEFKLYPYKEYNIVTSTLKQQTAQLQDAMENLELERNKISSILDQMSEGLILLDDNHRVLLVNQQIHKMFDIKVQTGQYIENYIFTPSIIEAIKKVSRKKQVLEVKIKNLVYSCLISKIDVGVIVLFVDVTMEKNAIKMRQEFFSNVSHELKTPMTSIKGYSELLEAGLINDEKMRKTALHKIQDEVGNMSVLINDILMISRLENKDIENEKVPIMIKQVVQDVIDSMEPIASKRGIELINDCGSHTYLSSHQQIHQLLNNLIVNAIKYNVDNGNVRVTSNIEGGYLRISVRDTGIGIPLADQGRVFERFYRVEKGREKTTGGSGLGLAIVKHIVQYNKGYIDLKSAIDKGTSIHIYLPMPRSK